MPSSQGVLNTILYLIWLSHWPFPSKNPPFLSTEELPNFVQVLEAYTGSIITKDATKIVMLTGLRIQNMRFATWCEIDFD